MTATDTIGALVERLSSVGCTLQSVTDSAIVVQLAEKTATVSLHNLHRQLEQCPPAQHSRVLAAFVRAILQGLSPDTERGVLLPRITAPGDSKSVSAPWFLPLADGALWLTLIEDRGRTVRFIKPMDFVRWRLSLADARSRALENLRAWSTAVQPTAIEPGVWQLSTQDGLDAARLLILSRWFPQPVYALPLRRDLLLLCAEHAKAVRLQQQHGPTAHVHPYAISRRLFLYDRGVISVATASRP